MIPAGSRVLLAADGVLHQLNFETLVSNAGRVVQSQRLIELIWNYEGGDAFSLKTHISHIRHKLDAAKRECVRITCVPRIGYRLEAV